MRPDTEFPPLKPFWEAAQREELRLPRCRACERFNWYPEPECIHCGGADFEWVRLSGKGSLFSWAVVRRALHPEFAAFQPYVSGIVTIAEDERVRMVTRLLVDADQPLEIGQPVRAQFVDLGHPVAEAGVIGVLWSLETDA
jgi:uncharacterized OB-fold protein